MKILLLNPNYIKRHNWGHQLFKNEIGRHHEVTYYGSGYEGFNSKLTVPQILKHLKTSFDIILTYESKYSKNFKELGDINHIPKVLIQIDYAIGIPDYKGFADTKNINGLIEYNKPDLIFFTSMSNIKAAKNNLDVDKIFFLPFSVDTNIYKNKMENRTIDVMATYTTNNKVYLLRGKIQKTLNAMKIKTFTRRAIHRQYINHINKSKIFVISNNINRRLSMKYTEAMACGAMVLADEPEDLTRQGFKRNHHLVLYNGIDDLKNKIQYYLKHDEERKEIATNGMNFVKKNHSCSSRVKQFTKMVKRELGI